MGAERRRETLRPGLAFDAVTLSGSPRDANLPERARRPRSRAKQAQCIASSEFEQATYWNSI